MDDLRHYKERERGAKAKSLLDDTILNEILDDIVNTYIDRWGQSTFSDMERRESCFRMVTAIGNLRAELESVAANGRIAHEQIHKEQING